MLPAPTTTATSTPRCCAAAIWRAIAATRSGSVPKARSPMRASPESFSRTRPKAGASSSPAMPACGLSADLEPREVADDDVLARLVGDLLADLLDRAALVLVRVDVRLLEQ